MWTEMALVLYRDGETSVDADELASSFHPFLPHVPPPPGLRPLSGLRGVRMRACRLEELYKRKASGCLQSGGPPGGPSGCRVAAWRT